MRLLLRSCDQSRLYTILLMVLAGVTVLGRLAGLLPGSFIAVVIMAAALSVVVAVVVHRPTVRWPWWSFFVAGCFWAVGVALRIFLGVEDDLTVERSLVPDIFNVIGYLCFIPGLVRLTGGPEERTQDRAGAVDGLLVSLGGFLFVWEFLIGTGFETAGVSESARISIAIYPVLDVILLALALRLVALGHKSFASHLWLLAGITALAVGDFLFALDQLGRLSVGAVSEVPHVLAAAFIAAAAAHPSVKHAHLQSRRQRPGISTSQLILLAVALAVPGAVFIHADIQGTRHGGVFYVALSGMSVLAVLRLLEAASRQAQYQLKVQQNAERDDLTGLPSRLLTMSELEHALVSRHGPKVASFFDLNRFKYVNDVWGHSAGDRLLADVGARLLELREKGVFIGRFGGDEFIGIGAHELSEDDVVTLIASVFDEPFVVSGTPIAIGVSIGTTVISDDMSSSEVLRNADSAMYAAKTSGMTWMSFSADLRQNMLDRELLEHELRDLVERGGVEVVFQPIVSLHDMKIGGFEALARWPGGKYTPDEFIPVAEETGLIADLGWQVFKQSIDALSGFLLVDPTSYMQVNISTMQLSSSEFRLAAVGTLFEAGIPAGNVCVEVTESQLADQNHIDQLHALRSAGFKVAIDDFGTGYSSLAALHLLPVDRLKLDRLFLSSSTGRILSSIVSMANSLGLRTIAEGVETQEHLDQVASIGCYAAQGFRLGMPLSAAAAALELRDRNRPNDAGQQAPLRS